MKNRLIKLGGIVALSLDLFISPMAIQLPNSFAFDTGVVESTWGYDTHGWSFTREDIKKIYEKEYREEERLKNPIRVEDGRYVGSRAGKTFEVPKEFIQHILNHLEQMLEKGYAEYIFRLDAYHGHIFIPGEKPNNPEDIKEDELIAEFTKKGELGILYHNAEHLALRNPPETGEIDPKAEELISKRSVLGWYDGRPLELIYPKESVRKKLKESNCAEIPDGCYELDSIHFKATKNGEFIIRPNGKEIKIDISFDDYNYY